MGRLGGLSAVAAMFLAASLLASSLAFLPNLFQPADVALRELEGEAARLRVGLEFTMKIAFLEANVTGDNRVNDLEIRVRNEGKTSLRADELPYVDLILRYPQKVGGGGKNPLLEVRVVKIPYQAAGGSGSTHWAVAGLAPDLLNPLDGQRSAGAWDPGETATLVVKFKPEDRPYFDRKNSRGFFNVVLAFPGGATSALNVLDARVFAEE